MMPLLVNVAEIQNFPTCHQDLSMEKLATSIQIHLHTFVDACGSVQVNGVDGVVLVVIQITDDPSAERTAPPRSTHVQPGDVSHALIQQGERERLGKTPSSSSTTVWWWWRSAVLQQGFAKHYERRGGREVGLRLGRERLVCWAAPKPPLYIGARGRGRRPRVSPRGAAARADGISPLGDLAPKPGGGNPRWGAPNP